MFSHAEWFLLMSATPWLARGVGAGALVFGLLAIKVPRIRRSVNPWGIVLVGGIFLLLGAPLTPTFLNL